MILGNDSNHGFICGITRSGKSYFAHRGMLEKKCGVVYFNIQSESVPSGFVRCTTDSIDTEQLISMLQDGCKINLIFSDLRKGYSLTAGHILNALMGAGFTEKNPIYVGVDECHLLEGYSKEMAKIISTAGLKKGIRCIWITQRPANCDKTIYTQALEHYLFLTSPSDGAYLKSKGIPYDECAEWWGEKENRRYVYFNGYKIEKREKI